MGMGMNTGRWVGVHARPCTGLLPASTLSPVLGFLDSPDTMTEAGFCGAELRVDPGLASSSRRHPRTRGRTRAGTGAAVASTTSASSLRRLASLQPAAPILLTAEQPWAAVMQEGEKRAARSVRRARRQHVVAGRISSRCWSHCAYNIGHTSSASPVIHPPTFSRTNPPRRVLWNPPIGVLPY